jgi:hypothetical protein
MLVSFVGVFLMSLDLLHFSYPPFIRFPQTYFAMWQLHISMAKIKITIYLIFFKKRKRKEIDLASTLAWW